MLIIDKVASRVQRLIGKSHSVPPACGRMAVRNRFSDLKTYVKNSGPLIVDGGAHTGATIELFLSQYEAATIHAFEPIPGLAKTLKKKYSHNRNVVIHECALGARSLKTSFNILNNDESSSIMKPTSILRRYHGNKMDIMEVVEIETVRLDRILDQEIDILKFDLQGFELEALKGCRKLLEKTKAVTTEVEFVPLYEGQPLFADIDIYLRRNGFRLLNLYELWTHPDGQLTAGDAVYLNNRYF